MANKLEKLDISEVILIGSMYLWAFVLAVPLLSKKDQSFLPFLDVMPIWFWVVSCTFIGTFMLVGVVVKNKRITEFGMMFSGTFWVFMSVLVMLNGSYLHSVSYTMCAFMAFWLFIRKMKGVG